MNIPDKVKIGNVVYDVIISDEEIFNSDGQRCYGQTDYDFHWIKLNKKLQDLQGLKETFWHELLHDIVHQRNFNFKDFSEENIIEELARGLHELANDNPGMFKDVLESEK